MEAASSSRPFLDSARLTAALEGLRPYTRREVYATTVRRLRERSPGIDGEFQGESPMYWLLAMTYGLDPARPLVPQVTRDWPYWSLRRVFGEQYNAAMASWAARQWIDDPARTASRPGGDA